MGIMFPDISEWYTPERVAAEEKVWAKGGDYRRNAEKIIEVCKKYGLWSVIEAGCGTGWIPGELRDTKIYYWFGVDKNPEMLRLARAKNPGKFFVRGDLRNLRNLGPAHLVCSFAVLKHFSLEDWPWVLKSILSIGTFGLFTQHMLDDGREPFDAGREWHSIWPTRQGIVDAVTAAGHEVLDICDGTLDPVVNAPEVYVVTRRRT